MSVLVIEQIPIQKLASIEYPASDGNPMAETEVHVLANLQLLSALRLFFRKQNIYVIGNMFLYYRQGNPKARKAPDVMVVKNVGKHERRSFKVWEEKAIPCAIFDITSKETKIEDIVSKPSCYAALGVQHIPNIPFKGATIVAYRGLSVISLTVLKSLLQASYALLGCSKTLCVAWCKGRNAA